jgi:fumarate reductase subunit D
MEPVRWLALIAAGVLVAAVLVVIGVLVFGFLLSAPP